MDSAPAPPQPSHTATKIFETALGVPFFPDNSIVPLRNGDRAFPAMLEAIGAAETSIEMLTFVYWTGDIAQRMATALADRARAGVAVKLLLDGFGARAIDQSLLDRMTEAGVEIRWFRPLAQWRIWKTDNRTHRKVLVIDGRIGFTGGFGIAREWQGDAQDPQHWRDTHFRVMGPAVKGLRAAFWGNWMEVDHTVGDIPEHPAEPDTAGTVPVQVVRSTASVKWSDVALLFSLLISRATTRLWIATPYFAPDADTARQLCQAAGRGVDVQIMIPGPHIDKRISEYSASEVFESLIAAGVRLLRYQPTMLHLKQLLIDDTITVIGSANLNQRSMRKDDEVVLVVLDRGLAGELAADFVNDRERCVVERLEQWQNRGPLRRLAEGLSRLLLREA